MPVTIIGGVTIGGGNTVPLTSPTTPATGTGVGVGAGVDLGGVGVGVGVGAGTGTGASGGATAGAGVGVATGPTTGGAAPGTDVTVSIGGGVSLGGLDLFGPGGGAGGNTTGPTGGTGGSPTGAGSTGAGTGATSTASTSAGLPDPHTAFINIFRLDDASQVPTTVDTQLRTMDQQIANGSLTASKAIMQIADAAAGFTAVAETTYNFFTGLTPNSGGLSYLVHSSTNGNDLSDSYYSSFNLENRYINFASNLGLHSDYSTAFANVYGPMTFANAVSTAYDRIVGNSQATLDGVNVQAAVTDIISRQSYFQEVAQERFAGDNQDLATKLAAVAYIMEEAVRADVGRYGHANQDFLFDLADGKAQFHIDLVGTYTASTPTNMTL